MTRNLRQTFHESRLYHGTPEEFAPGDIIKPAEAVGKRASNDPSVAYASKDFSVAKFMAWEQNNFNGENFRKDSQTNPPTENVYRVEPVDPAEQLGEHSSLSQAIRIDLPEGLGPARDVTSTTGFRVLSKVQNPNRLHILNNLISSRLRNESSENAEQQERLEQWEKEKIKRTADAVRVNRKSYKAMSRAANRAGTRGTLEALRKAGAEFDPSRMPGSNHYKDLTGNRGTYPQEQARLSTRERGRDNLSGLKDEYQKNGLAYRKIKPNLPR